MAAMLDWKGNGELRWKQDFPTSPRLQRSGMYLGRIRKAVRAMAKAVADTASPQA